MLSRFIILSSKEQVPFNFMATAASHRNFETQENKAYHCFHCFPIYSPRSDGTRCHVLSFWVLSFFFFFECWALSQLFHSPLSPASIGSLVPLSFPSWHWVVSYAYLRLLIFLLVALIPAGASSDPAFHMMYSACKLNKQDDNIQPWPTPFPIWNQSVVLCLVLLLLDLHGSFSGG